MIVKTSKLYYPNPCKDATMAVNVGTDAYYINDFNSYATIILSGETTLTNLIIKVPSEKVVSGLAIIPKIYNIDDQSKTNLIPTPYKDTTKTVVGVKFIVNDRWIIIDGKAEKDTTAIFVIRDSLTLPEGQYVFTWGTKIDYHNDVYFAGKFHNAMFMENEDCDGLIYQVKHRPNNYILINGGDGTYGSYVRYYNKLIYPQDKFVLNTGIDISSYTNPDGGWYKTKNFLVRGGGYTYGGNATWSIASRDGRYFLNKRITGPAARNGSFSRTSDKGIIISDTSSTVFPDRGKIYICEVSNTEIKFSLHPYQLPDGSTILYSANGIIFYQKPNRTDLYYVSCDGTNGYTGTDWGEYHNGKALCLDDNGMIIIYGYAVHTQAGVSRCDRWAAKFDANGKHIKTYGYWDFPGYLDNTGVNTLYKFDDRWKLMCTRYDAFERRTVYDCYDYGPNFDPPGTVTYDAYNRSIKVPAVGWKTPDYRNSYYGGMDQNGYVTFRMNPYFNPNGSKVLYFKDGKSTEAYGYTVHGWQPYINRQCLAIIKGDLTTDPDEEPFLFEPHTTDYLDPHNITWKRKW